MSGLELWLKEATRCLSKESVARVRGEIREHYESAREAAMDEGATADDADRLALAALGDAKSANRQYRKVLLTSTEARLLGQGNWEAKFICSRRWVKRVFVAVPVMALLASIVLFLRGSQGIAQVMFGIGLVTGLLWAAPFLPIYTASRSRVFRRAKWTLLIGAFALICGPEIFKMSWVFLSVTWAMGWVEWQRISIRRKLPVSKWPRQLYL